MGQRLAINIHSNGELLANAYYHWAGYTGSALQHAKYIFESGLLTDDFIKAVSSPTQYAIKLLESTGAGYTDRNKGLIESDPEAMDNTNQWAEAYIAIDLINRKVIMDITWIADDEYSNEDYNECKVFYFPYSLKECSFEDFPALADLYMVASPDILHCPDGTIHRPIE